jgi:WD40 repeat protein
VDDPAALVWSVSSRRWLYSRPLFLPGEDRLVVFECRPGSWLAAEGLVYVTRDARTGKAVTKVPAWGESIASPVQSADRRLIAGRRRSSVDVLRTNHLGAEPVTLCNDTPKDFTALAFHPSGRYLAATSNDGTVKLYDTSTWAVAQALDWDIGQLRSVAFSPDGMLAAAGGDKGKIVVWDVDL